MNQQYDLTEKARLEALFDSSIKSVDNASKEAHRASIDIATEKTKYFEKIAIGSGATIALMVSFVGSHQGRLHPPWLLRSALVALVLSMICAMLRNWRFPFYTWAYYLGQKLKAERVKENRKKDLITSSFPPLSMEDGNPIDVDQYLRNFDATSTKLTGEIIKFDKKEKSTFLQIKRIEFATLILAVIGMTLLIALAWINF